jgi:hypothetical protein
MGGGILFVVFVGAHISRGMADFAKEMAARLAALREDDGVSREEGNSQPAPSAESLGTSGALEGSVVRVVEDGGDEGVEDGGGGEERGDFSESGEVLRPSDLDDVREAQRVLGDAERTMAQIGRVLRGETAASRARQEARREREASREAEHARKALEREEQRRRRREERRLGREGAGGANEHHGGEDDPEGQEEVLEG